MYGTGTQLTTKSSSSALPVRPSDGNQVTSNLNCPVPRVYIQYNVGYNQTRDRKPRYSKQGSEREIISYEASTDSPRRKAKVATTIKSWIPCRELNPDLMGELFGCISLTADGPQRARLPFTPTTCHPTCGHEGSVHLSPVITLRSFIAMLCSSTLFLQLVNQWLNFTYSCCHAFREGRQTKNPALTRIELTTSALAGVQGYLYYRPL